MTDLSASNLKRLLAETSPGPWDARRDYSETYHLFDAEDEYLGIMHDQDAHLTALAPELAQEVIRLRDGVERLLEMCLLERDAAFQDAPMRAGEVTAFNLCAERLTDLLTGDHDE